MSAQPPSEAEYAAWVEETAEHYRQMYSRDMASSRPVQPAWVYIGGGRDVVEFGTVINVTCCPGRPSRGRLSAPPPRVGGFREVCFTDGSRDWAIRDWMGETFTLLNADNEPFVYLSPDLRKHARVRLACDQCGTTVVFRWPHDGAAELLAGALALGAPFVHLRTLADSVSSTDV